MGIREVPLTQPIEVGTGLAFIFRGDGHALSSSLPPQLIGNSSQAIE